MKEIILLCVSITLLVGGGIYSYINPLYFRITIKIGHVYLEHYVKGSIKCDRLCDMYEEEFDASCECELIGKKTYEVGKNKHIVKHFLPNKKTEFVPQDFERLN